MNFFVISVSFKVDLETEKSVAQIQHELKVNWLELNETAKYLLFRDIKMKVSREIRKFNRQFLKRNVLIETSCICIMWSLASEIVSLTFARSFNGFRTRTSWSHRTETICVCGITLKRMRKLQWFRSKVTFTK